MGLYVQKQTVYSCYAPPSLTLAEFEDMLGRVDLYVKGQKSKVIACDFDALAAEWGSSLTTARWCCLLEAFGQLDIVLANDGHVNIYLKGRSGSAVDLTFVSPSLVGNRSWKVGERYTHSDHQAKVFILNSKSICLKSARWPAKIVVSGIVKCLIFDRPQISSGNQMRVNTAVIRNIFLSNSYKDEMDAATTATTRCPGDGTSTKDL